MNRFVALYQRLDETNATSEKVRAMADYFAAAPAEDAAWAVYLLCGRRLKRLIPAARLRAAVAEVTGHPLWLIEETHSAVGDLAETAALLVAEPGAAQMVEPPPLHEWMQARLPALRDLDETGQIDAIRDWWGQLPTQTRFVLNKLLTGGLRVGVSQRLVVRALARLSGHETDLIAHRLTGNWQPSASFFRALTAPETDAVDTQRPYPFYLASPLKQPPDELGPAGAWLAEWKWDGIRAQLLVRDDHVLIWSRGEESLDGQFPEIESALQQLPAGHVLDGEILAWREGGPLPFTTLQRRLGRQRPSRRIREEAPVVFMGFDLLEAAGEDLRGYPLSERRIRMERLLDGVGVPLLVSPELDLPDWATGARLRDEARQRRTEGLLLKRRTSPYRVGRRRGDWWKWKVDPRTLDAVLLYAQPGHGRRSSLLTDYTFAVWDDERLVPIAKAYSGLDQSEIERLDHWIRRNTRERFGPVRSVHPQQVFELACDGIQRSPRHKAGLTLRFPRIHRWRHDLTIKDADRLEDVGQWLDD